MTPHSPLRFPDPNTVGINASQALLAHRYVGLQCVSVGLEPLGLWLGHLWTQLDPGLILVQGAQRHAVWRGLLLGSRG